LIVNIIIGSEYTPASCKEHLTYAYEKGKNTANKDEWYPEMKEVTGLTPEDATFEDFQREFKCKNLHSTACNDKGLPFPSTCSFPPCDQCTVENDGKFKIFYTKLL
jgi:hypothetical protein